MDESSTGTVGGTAAAGRAAANGSSDGLAEHVAAVEAARDRLGRDLEQLNTEVRAQVSQTVERAVWKIATAGAAVVAGLVVRKLIDVAWRKATKSDPPEDAADPRTGLGMALTWTVATAVGAGVAKVVAARGAAAGWKKATGSLPPGVGSRVESGVGAGVGAGR